MPLPIGLLKLYLPRLEPLKLEALSAQGSGRYLFRLDHSDQSIAFTGQFKVPSDGATKLNSLDEIEAHIDSLELPTDVMFSAGEGPEMALRWGGEEAPIAFDLLGVVEADWDLEYTLRDT